MPQQVVYAPFANSEPSNCASSVHPPLERKRSRTEEDHESEVDNAFFVEGRGNEADLSAYRSMNEKPPTVKFHPRRKRFLPYRGSRKVVDLTLT